MKQVVKELGSSKVCGKQPLKLSGILEKGLSYRGIALLSAHRFSWNGNAANKTGTSYLVKMKRPKFLTKPGGAIYEK